jgi:tripartite-type tricarboxylate transporter receptor subunit TctC
MQVTRALLSVVAAIGAGLLDVDPAAAQTYPTRPITMILPFPPGNTSDIVVRALADQMMAKLGQPVVIDHRPGGAGGTIGAKTVPIATLFSSPQLLVVDPRLPVNSMQELVAYAKANPGKISFASPGYGTQPHLLGEMLRLTAAIEITHVPYRGPAQIITDLIAGQVQMDFETITLLLPHVEAGKLKALALADTVRSPQLPNVPTTIESGFPKLQATFWSGVLAPAGTPANVVGKLNATINDIMRSRELAAILGNLSAKPKVGTPQDFAAFMTVETEKWAAVVKGANIRVD